MKRNWPNFLIIGAAKSGTTALYHILKKHPRIYMSSVKEPNFFALDGKPARFNGPGDDQAINNFSIENTERYLSLFEGVRDEIAIGEASIWYLFSDIAPVRIKKTIPNAKLIVILRNPIDRAFSQFLHLRRDKREPYSNFSKAFDASEERIQSGWEFFWDYKGLGFYGAQLARYYQYFPPDQIRVYLYEDFVSNYNYVIQDIFKFLHIPPPDFELPNERHNEAGYIRNQALERFLNSNAFANIKIVLRHCFPHSLRKKLSMNVRSLNHQKPALPFKTVSKLAKIYEDDIHLLGSLINRDLSFWLNTNITFKEVRH
jgi:hypothetical protein